MTTAPGGFDAVRFLRDELHRSLHGQAWHGPALLEALREVSWQQAITRPATGSHGIAEIAGHCIAWLEEVTRRLDGSAPCMPARGDWNDMSQLVEDDWTNMLRELAAAGEALDAALANLAPERLLAVCGDGLDHDAPLGSGVRFATMLNGVIQHNVYHAGQVVLLARMSHSSR